MFMIPFLFLFGSIIRLQREPAGPEVRRVPGGKWGAILCGVIGLVTVSAAIVFSFVLIDEGTDPLRAAMKLLVSTIVILLVGLILFFVGRRRSRSPQQNSASPTS